MNEPDDLLSFLIEGLSGQQRDLVTKAFYNYAQGDPNSGPVNEAVLLTAFSRRIARAPRELREASAEFSKLLAGGQEMEARIRERVELSNFGVVASIKDEATRAATSLRDSSRNNQEIVAEGRQIVDLMRKSRAHGDLLLSDLREIKAELKANRESNQKTAEATENSKNSILKIKEIVLRVNHVFAISWISIGVGIGFVLCIIATQVSGWLALVLLALAIGLLQAIARNTWKIVQEMAEGLKRLI